MGAWRTNVEAATPILVSGTTHRSGQVRPVGDGTHYLVFLTDDTAGDFTVYMGVVAADATPSISLVGSLTAISNTFFAPGYWGWTIGAVWTSGFALLHGTFSAPDGFSYPAHQLVSFDVTTGAITMIGDPHTWGAVFVDPGYNPNTVNPYGSIPPSELWAWSVAVDATHLAYSFSFEVVPGFPPGGGSGTTYTEIWIAVASIDFSTGVMTYVDEVLAMPATTGGDTDAGGARFEIEVAPGVWIATTADGSTFYFGWDGSAVSGGMIASSSTFIALRAVDLGTGEWRVYGADQTAFEGAYCVIASDLSGLGVPQLLTKPDHFGDPTTFVGQADVAITGDGTKLIGPDFIWQPNDTHARSDSSPLGTGQFTFTGPGRYVIAYGYSTHTNQFVLLGEEIQDRYSQAEPGPPDFLSASHTGQQIHASCLYDHLDTYWRPIDTWRLAWGDGSADTGPGPLTAHPLGTSSDVCQILPHTFWLPGIYTVSFTVRDTLGLGDNPIFTYNVTVTRATPPWQRSYPRPDDLGAGSHRSFPPPATRQRSSRSIPAAIE